LGSNFKVTTFGESHGAAIGVVIDGCPPGFSISETDIQIFLDKRRPGQSDLVTPRQEADAVQILSGVFEGKTLGTPICLLIHNTSMKSSDYNELKENSGQVMLTADIFKNMEFGIIGEEDEVQVGRLQPVSLPVQSHASTFKKRA
jgi:Chorismate synthase